MRARRHRRRRHPFASRAVGVSALAVVGVTVSCISQVAAASPGHGVLPLPPPPPPPPPQVSAVAKIGENEAIDGDDEPKDVPIWPQSTVGGDDDSVASDDSEMTREPQTVQATPATQDGSFEEPVPRITAPPENALSGNDRRTGYSAERSNQNNMSQSYQSITQPNSNQYDPHQYNQHLQQYHHHYQGDWQHQHHNQHPPPTYDQRRQPPPQGQLAVYRRPQPPSASQSASRLFSFAANKILSGIDTVTENLDANKLSSSVSSLTSRISSIANNKMNGPDPRRPHNAMGNMESRMPPRARRPPPQSRDPRGGGPPKKESYAPPIDELFSIGGTGAEIDIEANPMPARPDDEDGDEDGDADGGFDDGDEKEEMETFPNFARPKNEHPKPFQPSDYDRARYGEARNPPYQPRPRDMKPANRKPRQFELRQENGRTLPPSTDRYDSPRWRNGFDDDSDSSLGSKVSSVLGACVPRVPKFWKTSSDPDDDIWSDDESDNGPLGNKSKPNAAYNPPHQRSIAAQRATSMSPQVQSLLNKRSTFLSDSSINKCASIGRHQAVMRAGQLALVALALRETVPLFFDALSSNTIEGSSGAKRTIIISTLVASTDGWAFHALAAAILLLASDNVWIKPRLCALAEKAASETCTEAAFTKLYLRVQAALPMQNSFSNSLIEKSTRAHAIQYASLSQLKMFVSLALVYVLVSTVAVLRPATLSIAKSAVDIVKISAWQKRPIVWQTVKSESKEIGLSFMSNMSNLLGSELERLRREPLRAGVVVSLLLALLAVIRIPYQEARRNSETIGTDYEEDEGDTVTSLWSNIGSSSASRLNVLSSPRGVKGAIAQFTKLRPDGANSAGITYTPRRRRRKGIPNGSVQPLMKTTFYSVVSFALLSIPAACYMYLLAANPDGNGDLSFKSIQTCEWTSLFQLEALLLFTQMLVNQATSDATKAATLRLQKKVGSFYRQVTTAVSELQNIAAESSAGADFQAMLTANPTRGIDVSDLWAAHSSRQAWAVKGANLQCRNGEVILILGSSGAGKSRLLTSLAEHIFVPPRSARTTTYVRGKIEIAGVDLVKWDRRQLQQRIGICLSDVRTISDYASLYAGCTLGEILEPIPIENSPYGQKEKNAMSVAMKTTGLSSSVISRFPSKLSTCVTSNEDELRPSGTRPASYPLSPSDWSRVMLTKTLAQLISGNEQLSSPDSVKNCLVGSVLLLDDATSQMSESDEGNLIKSLRSTNAAVLLTSNRWACGRFADRIVVMSGGGVIECGTHDDLLTLGPENSLYARQWYYLTQ